METKNFIFFFKKVRNLNFDFLTKCWNHHSFVNISPKLVIDTSMERSSRVLHHRNPKIVFFFQKSLKFEFWLLTKSWNHLSFVNISPTLVIDTSMERSSRVLQHGNQKIWFFFFKKVWNWIRLVFWLVLKSWNQHSSRSQHAPICRHRGCIVVPLRKTSSFIFPSII